MISCLAPCFNLIVRATLQWITFGGESKLIDYAAQDYSPVAMSLTSAYRPEPADSDLEAWLCVSVGSSLIAIAYNLILQENPAGH